MDLNAQHTLPASPGLGNLPELPTEDVEVQLEETPEAQSLVIEHSDGSVTINFAPPATQKPSSLEHFGNIAESISEFERNRIAEELLQLIEADNQSRADWLEMRAANVRQLGLKLEQPGTADASIAVDGQSTVKHPLLLTSVIDFQSNAMAEMLPADGPVKIRNDGKEDKTSLKEAEDLEKDLNHYLTVTDKSYYPDTDRLLFSVGLDGCGFKKLYHDPLKKRPVSVSVNADDLIVSNAAADLAGCGRITHRIKMRPSVFKRMQRVGAYIEDGILQSPPPSPIDPNPVEEAKLNIQGMQPNQQINVNPEEAEREIYECCCEYDMPGYEDKDGIPLPWKVTIDVGSRKILGISRNWNEFDENKEARITYVKYPFIPYTGFYEIGLGHVHGNTVMALTAAWRLMLDAGMFANFPGFLVAKELGGRQLTNEFRVGPGTGSQIQTNGKSIRDTVMELPYKDITAGLLALVDKIAAEADKLNGAVASMVSEGKQDAPVGTTIALIEQATKIMRAVHKRLCAAQAEEFQILKMLFAEDPEAFWRHNKKASRKWNEESLRSALNNQDLVPAADPNTPSHMHRLMKCVALKQLQQANPELYNAKEVDERILRIMGFDDIESLFLPPQPQGPDPTTMIAAEMAALKKDELAIKNKQIDVTSKDKAADRASKFDVEVLKIASNLAVHPESVPVVEGAVQNIPGMVGARPS